VQNDNFLYHFVSAPIFYQKELLTFPIWVSVKLYRYSFSLCHIVTVLRRKTEWPPKGLFSVGLANYSSNWIWLIQAQIYLTEKVGGKGEVIDVPWWGKFFWCSSQSEQSQL